MGKRIHVLDDDRLMQSLLQASLLKRGFDVTVFFDSYQIFDIADNLPDLFIMDVLMPGLNGLEACKWLKSQYPDIPVIILSGTPGLKVLAENAHADDFVEKPFNLPRLLEKINRCLKKSSGQTNPVS